MMLAGASRARLAAVPALTGLVIVSAVAVPRAAAAPQHGFPGTLFSVAASSPGNAWASGGLDPGSPVVHWNGKSWKQLASLPFPVTSIGGMAATSAGDAWMAGSWEGTTLIGHWNGKAWKRVRSPSPGNDGNVLNAVAATSVRNAWAVGEFGENGEPHTLILHWDGESWKRVPSPNPGSHPVLEAVTATSARNAWAVGSTGPNGVSFDTVILHWNGTKWTRVPSPDPGGYAFLNSVSATSAGNAWAAGGGGTYGDLLHWNGTKWTAVPVPAIAGLDSSTGYTGVTVVSPRLAWAVSSATSTHVRSVIVQWNGKAWQQVSAPNPDAINTLNAITAISATNAWAVGRNGNGSLIDHWDGTKWTIYR